MTNVRTRFVVSGVEVDVVSEGGRHVLSTVVFSGGNYVPPSVRAALASGPDYELRVDEENFTVVFRLYAERRFPQLVEQFVDRAIEWRYILEDRGEQDLVRASI